LSQLPKPPMDDTGIELTIVMPCLNEAETLEKCIAKAKQGLANVKIAGEIVVADNGSTDGSIEIARRLGARVVEVPRKGYGSALIAGMSQARGKYLIMGDSDDSYDFSTLDAFVAKLRQGADLVMGCRMPSGGGTIVPGAMPFLHQYLGNPVLSFLGRNFFHNRITDYNCGMRGLTRDAFHRLRLLSPGMEFASEMVIRASLLKLDIAEVPITLHPDGRSRPPHLRTWRDGWRHLKLMLVYCPLWLYLIPGAVLLLLGGIALAVLLARSESPGGIPVSEWLATATAVTGYQVMLYAALARSYLERHDLIPSTGPYSKSVAYWFLRKGKQVGFALLILGTVGVVSVLTDAETGGMREWTVGMTRLLALSGTVCGVGAFTFMWGFFCDMIDIRVVETP
jgi:glycosyltransferase involved in cell wall biosynthesis